MSNGFAQSSFVENVEKAQTRKENNSFVTSLVSISKNTEIRNIINVLLQYFENP